MSSEAKYQVGIYNCLIALEKNESALKHWKEMKSRWEKR